MKNPFGYRHGAVGDYTGGDPAEAKVAWKALDYEFRELGNSYLLTDVARFLGIESTSWTDVITKFRKRYGNVSGTWLVRNKKNLHLYRDYGDIGRWKYDKDKVITGYGDEDGFFVIGAREVEMNPIRRKSMNYPIASVKNMKKFEKMGKHVIAFSSFTPEEYSATPGDYWQYPDTYILKDSEGNKMYLGIPTSGMRRPNPTKRGVVTHFWGKGFGWGNAVACGMPKTKYTKTSTKWSNVTCQRCLSTKHR